MLAWPALQNNQSLVKNQKLHKTARMVLTESSQNWNRPKRNLTELSR